MGKTCKYYKEKQLVSYDNGNTWQPTGLTRRGELYESDSTDCGYILQYKWEVVSGYVCDVTTYTKYEKTQKFKSTDGGQTWEAVVPALYGRGNVIETNSEDCGWTPPPMDARKITVKFNNGNKDYIKECDGLTTLSTADTLYNDMRKVSAATAVTIGKCVNVIGSNAIHNYDELVSLTIPSGVTKLEYGSCAQNDKLKYISLPNTLKSIGMNAFWFDQSLLSLTIPDSVEELGQTMCDCCYSLSSITIGNGVTRIPKWAFTHTNLNYLNPPMNITIPSGVTFIDSGAFWSCNFDSITLLAETPPELGYEGRGTDDFNLIIFYSVHSEDVPSGTWSPQDFRLFVPCNSLSAYKAAWPQYADKIYPNPSCA